MPRTRANHASKKLSTNSYSDSDYVNSSPSPSPSPSCDNSVIRDLNCGEALNSPSDDPPQDSPKTGYKETEIIGDLEEEASVSSDET